MQTAENAVIPSAGVTKVKTKAPMQFSRVYVNDYQKEGTKTLEVKQVVHTETSYPSKKTQTSMNGGLFSAEEFGFTPKVYPSTETRTGWVLVPVNASEESIKANLEAAIKNGATLYRVLSNAPILDENQLFAIASPNIARTKDDFANKMVVRYPDNHEDESKHGKLILDGAGNPQYRRIFYWGTHRDDEDQRGGEVYLTPEIKAELAGASAGFAGQTI